jgi:hypothetical protein
MFRPDTNILRQECTPGSLDPLTDLFNDNGILVVREGAQQGEHTYMCGVAVKVDFVLHRPSPRSDQKQIPSQCPESAGQATSNNQKKSKQRIVNASWWLRQLNQITYDSHRWASPSQAFPIQGRGLNMDITLLVWPWT